MSSYFDANEVRNILLQKMAGTGYQSKALDCLLYIEPADVEPVRHAKWIKCENHLRNSDGKSIMLLGYVYECPLCGRKEESAEPYCNCGAKMDLKEKQNATN